MAALVAAYMFGMMNGVPQTRNIAVTASQTSATNISVTYAGGPDQANLGNLTILWPSGALQRIELPKVGDTYAATNFGTPFNVTSGRDHIVVTAIYKNNQSQVALDTYV